MPSSLYLPDTPPHVRAWIENDLRAHDGYYLRFLWRCPPGTTGITRSARPATLYIGVFWEVVPPDVRAWFSTELRKGPGDVVYLRSHHFTPDDLKMHLAREYPRLRRDRKSPSEATRIIAVSVGRGERQIRRLLAGSALQ